VAAAIARPPCTRCLRGHREEKRSSVARVSTVAAREGERRFLTTEYQVIRVRTSWAVKSIPCTWLQHEKRQIQAPGTIFSTFSDDVRLEGHGNCCRFATHGSAPRSPCLPCQIKKKIGARAELRNVLQEKLRGRGGSSCRFDRLQKNYLWATQHRRHKKKSLAGRYHIPSPEKKTPSV